MIRGTELKSWKTDKSACEQNTVLSGKAHSKISCNPSRVSGQEELPYHF